MQNLVIEVEGGVVQGVYSDWLSRSEINIILIDHDNIDAGDVHPLPNFNRDNYNVLL